jgi:hypothetical protein
MIVSAGQGRNLGWKSSPCKAGGRSNCKSASIKKTELKLSQSQLTSPRSIRYWPSELGLSRTSANEWTNVACVRNIDCAAQRFA